MNGTTPIIQDERPGNTLGNNTVTGITLWEMSANDYVEHRVRQSSGGSLDMERVASNLPVFWAVKVLG